MERIGPLIFIVALLSATRTISGCTMEGNISWLVPQDVSIYDIDSGVFFSRSTSNIDGIITVSFGNEINNGPYFEASLVDSQLTISTTDTFTYYEENESSESVSMIITLQCSQGLTPTSQNLVVMIHIIDTNNNPPTFIPPDVFEFTVVPPLPPGYSLTDCVNDIIARDIDLTTYRVDFAVIDNEDFEIAYDESASTEDKQFKASLRTTSFIRSIPEPLRITISATDVDRTGDDPITTYSTIQIEGSNEFELPEEPVFSQAYYLADYTIDEEVVLQQAIFLTQGYDDEVDFTLQGDQSDYFDITDNENRLSITVRTPLTNEILRLKQIYLIIVAEREFTSGASATVIVQLPEEPDLQFEQIVYRGQIENNILSLSDLVLTQGYENEDVVVSLSDYSSYFTAVITGGTITITMSEQASTIIEENSFITFTVTASTDRSSATAVVTLDIIKDDNITPVFEKDIYTGSYDAITGLSLETISLVQGYDDTVVFRIEGEHEEYFTYEQLGPTVNVIASSLPSDIFREQNLLLTVVATKPRTVGATTVVSITLPTELALEFEQIIYRGQIENGVLSLSDLILTQGYENQDVIVTLSDYNTYFTTTITGDTITISISEQASTIIEENSFITFTVTAATDHSSATAVVTLDIIKDDNITPVFEKDIYTGSYDAITGLSLETISLVQGYDDTVVFRIEGEHEEYFTYEKLGPTVNVIASSLPSDIFREQNLLLTVVATKPRTVGATTVVSITLPTELALEFEQIIYRGQIENGVLSLSDLILTQGYENQDVIVTLSDYNTYFTARITGDTITISISEQASTIIEENSFITFTVTAATDHSSATAVVTLDIFKDDNVTPVFENDIYIGSYDTITGLSIEPISLVQGYDDTVAFRIEGEHEEYFTHQQVGPIINLIVDDNLPPEILSEQHLLLTVVATKPRTVGATTVVSISLPSARELAFQSSSYNGAVNNTHTIMFDIIELSIGYDEDVIFDLSGDYANYFTWSNVGNLVTINLSTELPESVVSANNYLILTLTASGVNTVSASTNILVDILKEDTTTPIFSQYIYNGQYSEMNGFEINERITLTQGYDDTVSFRLEGEYESYFYIAHIENEVTIILRTEIPEEIIQREKVLLVNIIADKPLTVGSNAVLRVDSSQIQTIIGFDRIYYLGAIEDNESTLEPIVLSVGYSSEVSFELIGALSTYFTVSSQEEIVTVTLTTPIPEDTVPSNRIVLLELQATALKAKTAHATIVFEVINDDVAAATELIFDQPYYTGVYTEEDGLVFENTISLSHGYDQNVEFDLEGDHSQWFSLERVENEVTLMLTSAIPAPILLANQNLVFVVTANSPKSNTARTTVVLSLTNEFTDDATVLGFERISYLGTIENNASTLEPIVLSVGYSSQVSFELIGALSTYFTVSSQEEIVTVILTTPIPEDTVPSNRIILQELQASAPNATTAHATIVFEVIKDDVAAATELIFDQPYYTGVYTEEDGLVFENTISLSQGYDQNVEFDLEGDHSQWFSLERVENEVTLMLTSAIPAPILLANQNLVFVVTANSPKSNTARTTVVLSLTNEFTDDATVLGFERISYLGTIENNASTLEPIVLSVGYSSQVSFELIGALSTYFTVSSQEEIVTVILTTPIPEDTVPSNRIILQELQASAPNATTAHATIVFEVIKDDVAAATELIFDQPYYTGVYTEEDGLVFENTISLSQGYDQNVEFDLEGDHSQWFSLERVENEVTLMLTSAIPAPILLANQNLVFVVTANSPKSNTARTTVVLSLTNEFTDDATVLGFERISYLGTIENNASTLEPIVLSVGYSSQVSFELIGALSTYFTVSSQEEIVTVILTTPIPEDTVPSNRIILQELQASAPNATTAHATIVFEVIKDDVAAATELIFDQPYYTGVYTEEDGLVFENTISLSQGYDQNVEFDLEGDHSQWFSLERVENEVTLMLTSAIPAPILLANQNLVFVVTANSPKSNTARTTVVLSLTNEFTDDATVLGFERISYLGTIENNASTLEPIVLSVGYSSQVSFELIGALSTYFTVSSQEEIVTVILTTPIPEDTVPSNRIILQELQASAPNATTTHATIVFEVIKDDVAAATELIFDQPYYTGVYTEEDGLVFENTISLSQGYDQNVEFDLEGDHSQWFSLERVENEVTLMLTSAIPAPILLANQNLVFVVTANSPKSNTARTTVVLSLSNEFTDDATVLGFERISYLGTIENNASTLEPIVLSVGYSSQVSFELIGALSTYFTVSSQEEIVTVILTTPIPEDTVPSNRIILQELQASAPNATTAHATIVFEVIKDDVAAATELIFDQPYYTGVYTEEDGLVFENTISLSQGYDQNVEFDLEGDHSQWFSLERVENEVTLMLTSAIPAPILLANQNLVFVVTANSPKSNTARTTVVLSLTNEFTDDATVLGFERISYLGTIENNASTLEPIVLSVGYSSQVSFELIGALSTYFTVSSQEEIVTVILTTPIPEDTVPSNRIILQELQASAPNATTAHATIVFEVIKDDVAAATELIFDQPYYTGVYTEEDGLVFENTISLSQGYDQNVEFDLEGDHSQWFSLERVENEVTLMLTSAIPAPILLANQNLVFVVTANSPKSNTARTTVVLSLTNEFTDDATVLGFERISYLGTIENNASTLEPIVLSVGYSSQVSFELIGALSTYFTVSSQEEIVTVILTTPIPEDTVPSNRIILQELQASAPNATTAHATIVFEVIKDDVAAATELIFDQPYYTGVYTEEDGLVFENTISLSQGYDQNVEFDLEGDHSQWFSLERVENEVTLMLTSAIPAPILLANQNLVFVVTANSPKSNTARTTVVLSLTNEFTDDATVLGFERISYLGTIENNASTLEPIVLSVGYSSQVSFELIGALSTYFTVSSQEEIVTVILTTPIPEDTVPSNRIILQELQASAPNATTAHATIVFEVIKDDVAAATELIFDQPYYTGVYTEEDGLVFENTISLSQGYDQNVEFDLEGDHSQWFSLERVENEVTLMLTSAIPAPILLANQNLVFVVTANSPKSNTARTTVVLSLTNEFTDDATVLGFERISYLGTIENNASTLEPIVLSVGYSSQVSFELIGALSTYFTVSSQEEIVTVILTTPIPEDTVPSNRIILQELQASAPNATTTHATIVFEVIKDDVAAATELIFDQPYYTGVYTEEDGLVFENTISLSQGYDQNVEFDLEGDHSQWFSLERVENEVTLMLTSAIPAPILLANQNLVFVVTANSPKSNTARTTVVLSLTNEFTDDATVLGFERISYLGTIENNASTLEPIVLSVGYSSQVSFELIGALSTYFTVSSQEEIVTVILTTPIPEDTVPSNRIILQELQASAPNATTAHATIVFEVIKDDVAAATELIFDQPYYTGVYTEEDGLVFENTISLSQGYDQNVEFDLEGDHSQWFSLERVENEVTLMLTSAIPAPILLANQNLVFVVTANSPKSNTARTTVVLSLTNEFTDDATVLGFERISYLGTIENNASTLEPIVLSVGYSSQVSFELIGALSTYFTVSSQEEIVTVILTTPIPEDTVPSNRIILQELQASAPNATTAHATIVFEVIKDDVAAATELIFDQPYYTGVYTEEDGLVFENTISLSQGYDQNVEFDLEGDHSQWFSLERVENEVTLMLTSAIPAPILLANQNLVFVVTANSPKSNTARTTVVLSLTNEFTDDATVLGFERISYLGTIENNASTLEPIVLSVGYSSQVSFELIGALSTYFTVSSQEEIVTVILTTPIPEDTVPSNRIILQELQASAPNATTAHATIVFEVIKDDVAAATELIFDQPYYTGVYTEEDGLVFENTISLSQGYDQNVEFDLEGDHSQWFSLERVENEVTLMLTSAIPAPILLANQNLVFVVTANSPDSNTARTTIVISLSHDSSHCDGVFEKVVYEGIIQDGIVRHEEISITDYTGTVDVLGDYGDLFTAEVSNGVLTVFAAETLTLPTDIAYIHLELRAGGSSAVLILTIENSVDPTPPSVTFGSPIYVLTADIVQTGVLGQVTATADNGEAIRYSLFVENAHLHERISVNSEGELILSAPANSGVYNFQVIATTIFTQASGLTEVHLTVNAVTICDDDIAIQPLILLDRYEEEPHRNLVSITQFDGCRFSLTNRWPITQSWLYVDEDGLHTHAIDREHESIAFMALSQVQVELTIHCNSDETTRTKRSADVQGTLDWLGSYEYGSNQWVLTDSIPYNPRKTLVNLIVNDINDNHPVFIGKENEPLVVGYPEPEIKERVLPRALAELQATDADVGVNAAIVYWSPENELSVSPTTGSVHVRDGATVQNDATYIVYATDQHGEGLSGTIQLLVKLLYLNNIAVITVRNSFLEDESTILSNLSSAVGYEIKALRSVVISDHIEEEESSDGESRFKRDTGSLGASIQIYVYGLIGWEPVSMEQLKTDISSITTSVVIIAGVVSLEDHLEGQQICNIPGRDVGLLVATIVLSVLLFILIVAIVVWFCLQRRKNRNYDEFSDESSIASRAESLDKGTDSLNKPRMNIEDLKRSERKLQERLEAPLEDVLIETPIPKSKDKINVPIVIQSIDKLKDADDTDDEDEFGEVKRKKSIVHFNENVEKIIHVEDSPRPSTTYENTSL